MSLSNQSRQRLLAIAAKSIRHGLEHDEPASVKIADLPEELRATRATFVTLERRKQLRGCIGMLEARFPLGVDVANNAFSAAFRDPRFPPLTKNEMEGLDIHISILSPPEPLPCKDEQDLLAKLRPNIDGLIIADGWYHATFLPSVWEHLCDPRDFVTELKMKAGLAPDHWSKTLKVERYTTESVSHPKSI
ncbi:MAG: AmmeMemoRadiSam system protein A [bacterium]